MPYREFNEQILKTRGQWESGLPVGLSLGADGLSLFTTPSFETWLDRSPLGVDIVTDQCGQVWWVALDPAGGRWQLNRLDPKTHETESVIAMHDCDRIRPRKLWLTAETLLMFDERNARILGFSRENFQIVFEIDVSNGNLIDVDFAGAAAFHALIERAGAFLLRRYPLPPAASPGKEIPLQKVARPVAVAVSPEGNTYFLDAERGRLLRFTPASNAKPGEEQIDKWESLAAPSEAILKYFKPSIFEFDSRNVLFLAGNSTFQTTDLLDAPALAEKLKKPKDAVSEYISGRLSEATRKLLTEWKKEMPEVPAVLRAALVDEINRVILQGTSIWDEKLFANVSLRIATAELCKRDLHGVELVQLNRLLLEDVYGNEFSRTIRLHQFDAAGSYIGEARLPAEIESITGIGFYDDHICIATDHGLARLGLSITPVGQSGLYYCRALDNGEQEGLWHGFEFEGRLPARTSVEISYHVSSELTLKKSYDDVFKSKTAPDEQQKQIEKLLGRRWDRPVPATSDGNPPPPEIFRGSYSPEENVTDEPAPQDMLFLYNKGRYLFLKIAVTTFDEKSRPQIKSARILYQRKSYLRYLPAVYSEDPLAAAFLERFLSLFETVFDGLEEEITGLFHYFDPGDVRPRFLAWLQSWLNLAVDLPQDRLRRLLRQAPDIFSRKGTPSALVQFLELYTGKRVVLIEHSRMTQPLVLGLNEVRLGLRTVLVNPGPGVFRVGDTSIVGGAVLGSPETTPEAAFRPFIRRFSILVDFERNEFADQQTVLRRIVDEHKPAHTICSLGILSTRNRVGTAQLGINSTVSDIGPYRVGFSPLGEASAIAKGPPAPRMERGSRYGGKEGI